VVILEGGKGHLPENIGEDIRVVVTHHTEVERKEIGGKGEFLEIQRKCKNGITRGKWEEKSQLKIFGSTPTWVNSLNALLGKEVGEEGERGLNVYSGQSPKGIARRKLTKKECSRSFKRANGNENLRKMTERRGLTLSNGGANVKSP